MNKSVARMKHGALHRFTRRAAREAGLDGDLNVLVTSNRELQTLNRRFRQQNQPTDVLSFPAASPRAENLAGDIAVSAEMAAENANRLGHSALEEVKVLILHGILHLAGYDHASDHGEMARKEAHLRRIFRLPAGLIARQNLAPGRRETKAKTFKRRRTR